MLSLKLNVCKWSLSCLNVLSGERFYSMQLGPYQLPGSTNTSPIKLSNGSVHESLLQIRKCSSVYTSNWDRYPPSPLFKVWHFSLRLIALSHNGEVGFLQRLEILDELEMGFGGAITLGIRCFLGDIFGLHLDPIWSRLLGMGGRNGLVIIYCPAPKNFSLK